MTNLPRGVEEFPVNGRPAVHRAHFIPLFDVLLEHMARGEICAAAGMAQTRMSRLIRGVQSSGPKAEYLRLLSMVKKLPGTDPDDVPIRRRDSLDDVRVDWRTALKDTEIQGLVADARAHKGDYSEEML